MKHLSGHHVTPTKQMSMSTCKLGRDNMNPIDWHGIMKGDLSIMNINSAILHSIMYDGRLWDSIDSSKKHILIELYVYSWTLYISS